MVLGVSLCLERALPLKAKVVGEIDHAWIQTYVVGSTSANLTGRLTC